jgi:predicted RNA polymerase sigma factor
VESTGPNKEPVWDFMMSASDSQIEQLLRELTPHVLGAVIRRFRDFSAAAQWPREGVPENPRGWLIHVAARRMTCAPRSRVSRRQTLVAAETPADQQIVPAPDAEPETAAILATSVSGIEAA